MSKRESIKRYHLIIKRLRRKPATFKEIANYLSSESKMIDESDYNISIRTFQRDIKDIGFLYNIDIRYDSASKTYHLNDGDQDEIYNRLFEAFDTLNALNISEKLSQYISFEKRHPQGTEYLSDLLWAIQNQRQIYFSYRKYWEDHSTRRDAEPYALKEFKSRWYVIAKDLNDQQIKTFALDRLSKLAVTNNQFKIPQDFDVNEFYRDYFGVINSKQQEPEDVILSFNSVQGKYIKSLPLHESQQVIFEDEKEVRIKLRICITYDFVSELLSMGDLVKAIEPASLITDLKETYKNALEHYKH
ncbi:MAG: WYL domain-containing protein [Bacteroidota bacterium]|nr:WYL domain-containing protein [Bacteroidota bacterium]